MLELPNQPHSSHLTWVKPETIGIPPSPRESHTANIYTPSGASEDAENSSVLVIFGGMDGTRLGDLHMLKLGKKTIQC